MLRFLLWNSYDPLDIPRVEFWTRDDPFLAAGNHEVHQSSAGVLTRWSPKLDGLKTNTFPHHFFLNILLWSFVFVLNTVIDPFTGQWYCTGDNLDPICWSFGLTVQWSSTFHLLMQFVNISGVAWTLAWFNQGQFERLSDQCRADAVSKDLSTKCVSEQDAAMWVSHFRGFKESS